MRKPKIQPPQNLIPDEPPLAPGEVRQERHYRLITPLFGGGVEPGAADPVTIIRGTAIRGQLRFWWRATRGGYTGADAASLEDKDLLADMKRREAAIWGAASDDRGAGPSNVQAEVRFDKGTVQQQADHPFEVYPRQSNRGTEYRTRPNTKSVVHPYAAFPLQPTDDDLRWMTRTEHTKAVQRNISFTLLITFPEKLRKDVEAALWAWETFGGIGGRTRRGFGAIVFEKGTERCENQKPIPVIVDRPESTQEKVEEWIRKHLSRENILLKGRWADSVPYISDMLRFKSTKKVGTAEATWKYLLECLKQFRQQRDTIERNKKNPQTGTTRKIDVPGRNYWPEPDAIRALTGSPGADYTDRDGNLHDHTQPLYEVDGKPVTRFPRAAFGLPIIFKFKDDDARNGDPAGQYTLTAKKPGQKDGYERFASPLILRPLLCNNGQAVGLAAILENSHLPQDIYLVSGDRLIDRVDVELTADQARHIEDEDGEPLLTCSEEGQSPIDTLQDFLDYLNR